MEHAESVYRVFIIRGLPGVSDEYILTNPTTGDVFIWGTAASGGFGLISANEEFLQIEALAEKLEPLSSDAKTIKEVKALIEEAHRSKK